MSLKRIRTAALVGLVAGISLAVLAGCSQQKVGQCEPGVGGLSRTTSAVPMPGC
jgi:hypothetical protein